MSLFTPPSLEDLGYVRWCGMQEKRREKSWEVVARREHGEDLQLQQAARIKAKDKTVH